MVFDDEFKRKRVFFVEDDIVIFANSKKIYLYDCNQEIRMDYDIKQAFNVLKVNNIIYIQNNINRIYRIDVNTLELSLLPKTKKIDVFDDSMLYTKNKIVTADFHHINIFDISTSSWTTMNINDGYVFQMLNYRDGQLILLENLEGDGIRYLILDVDKKELRVIKQSNAGLDLAYYNNDLDVLIGFWNLDYKIYKDGDLVTPFLQNTFSTRIPIRHSPIQLHKNFLYFEIEDDDKKEIIEFDYEMQLRKTILTFPKNCNLHYSKTLGLLFVTIFGSFYKIETMWAHIDAKDLEKGNVLLEVYDHNLLIK